MANNLSHKHAIYSHLQNKAHIPSYPGLIPIPTWPANETKTQCPEYTIDQTDLLLHSTRHVLSGLYLNMKQKLLLLISGYYGCTYSCIMLLNSWRRHHMTLNLVTKPRQWIFQFTVQVIIHKMQNIWGSCHAGFLLFETCKRWSSRLENEATRMRHTSWAVLFLESTRDGRPLPLGDPSPPTIDLWLHCSEVRYTSLTQKENTLWQETEDCRAVY